MRGVCNYCSNHYSCGSSGGTGHIERHLRKKHNDEIGVDGGDSSGTAVCNFVYTKPQMRHGLALYVAAAEQPFTFGDDIRFEHFMQTSVNPAFCKVSRNTTGADCLKAFIEVRKNLITEIGQLGSTMSFTSDLWSGNNNLGYIAVTASYIDSSWILHKKIIAFRLLEYPHNANQIFQCINGVFREFDIVDKVFSITFDNHTANTAAIDLFQRNLPTPHAGTLFHMRCVCHIINLVVQDGLMHIGAHLDKIRDAIHFISSSQPRTQEFEGLCASFNVKPRKMKTDIKTRWNSTYLMLKSCVKHVDVITSYVNAKYGGCCLSQGDWNIAFEYMKFLKVFYAATCACSGSYYPTSCLVLNNLYNISLNFFQYRYRANFVDAVLDMETKFKKYFEDMPKIFILAAIMDPRIKIEGVVLLLDGIASNLDITLPSSSTSDVTLLVKSIYASYESKFASSTTNVAPSPSPQTSNDPSWSLLSSRGRNLVSRTELCMYLDMDCLTTLDTPNNLDILAWWKKNERTFPILSIMARDVLTPPVSSVASESAFSASKRVLDDKRSRLGADILDCLICLKDWEDARLGIKKCDAKDEFKDYFEISDTDSP